MKRIFILGVSLLMAVGSLNAQIFKGVKFPKGNRVHSGLAAMPTKNIKQLSIQEMRPIYRALQQHYSQKYLLESAQRGLVQIKNKPGGDVIGTGFLVLEDNKLYVAMARHVSGHVGDKRVAAVYNHSGKPLEFKVTVAATGQRGHHMADISLSEIPPEALQGGAKPLEIAPPDLARPAFSLGYTAGAWAHRDILPMERQLLSAKGFGLVGTRPVLSVENVDEPFCFCGYCGAPVFQLKSHRWQVVGMHVGSCGVVGEPEANRSFAVNLSKTIPLLTERLNGRTETTATRGVKLFGQEIAQLAWEERVFAVDVYRNAQRTYEQLVDQWERGFSEEYLEELLDEFPLQSGDEVYVFIECRKGNLRTVSWRKP